MEQLIITSSNKEEIYKEIIPQIKSITCDESDMIANMANIAAILKEAFGFFWVGFYIVKGEELVLGPFQGPLACTRIKYGRGVCGTAWKERRAIVVPDVDQFPGHIACSSHSRSEIVVPVYRPVTEKRKSTESRAKSIEGSNTETNRCIAVLDIDSSELNTFDSIDANYLQTITTFV